MTLLIGIDEAGYGPNLGPLVVGASVWRVPPHVARDLARHLHGAIAGAEDEPLPGDDCRLRIGDSKRLYSPALGLRVLEEQVLAAVCLSCALPECWRQAWQVFTGGLPSEVEAPWHLGFDRPLPLAADRNRIGQVVCRARGALAERRVELVAVRARTVFPRAWNALLDRRGNKATVLSEVTLELLCELIAGAGGEPVIAFCDKHGGRDRYQAVLQRCVDELVEVRAEGRESSVYAWGAPERRIEVRFSKQGERELPTALASMVAKYVRELAMLAFNACWQARVPGLRATAGYPTDAGRFMSDIAEALAASGMAREAVWRNK